LHARLIEFGGRGLRVRRLGGDRAGEIRLTRFLRNAAVLPEEMVGQAASLTAPRCAGRDVLVFQDTTVVRSEGGGGLYLHAAVAVDTESDAILGLTDARFLSRTHGRKALRKSKPIGQKESQRWIDAAHRSAEVCAGAARLTVIGDRENDIFEALVDRPEGADLLIRAAYDRALEDEGRLFATIDALPVSAWGALDIAARPGRKARQARIALRFARVQLARPRGAGKAGLPASIGVTVVDVREEAPPKGEAPVHWRLLASREATDAAEAFAIVDLYRRRWAIEQLFRTLKSQGFDIEDVLIEEEAPLRRLVMAALIAAVTIQQLVHARDGALRPGPLRPVTDAFPEEDLPLLEAFCAKLEGKTERQKNPHPRQSLAYAAWVCARLGGWTGYYGKPGPVVILEGWLYFQAAKQGATLSGNQNV
jgi:hypothetical protein